MDSSDWDKVQALFHAALEYPASERLAFLKAASGEDEQLVADVLELLAEDTQDSLLDQGIEPMAHQLCQAAEIPDHAFGPYHLIELLGEGGMGVVYLARRDDLGSLAAIKILRDAWMSPARRQRFAAEQRTLAQLTHPGIARLYDADTLADGTPWFAMEYVKGSPLSEYCRQKQSSMEERLKLLRSVCEAVRYAHSRAVIHRDLKPSNILVQEDGNVKLLDFGIAKQLDQTDAHTRTGLHLMTPAYAAPEQLRGEEPGTYTDIYALGVILHELLGSKRTLSTDLEVLCRTAMHPDPERRYGSADGFIRDINRYLANEPLEARPDSFGYRVRKFLKRNRRAVIAAGLSLAAMAGLVIFYTVRLRAARNEALAQTARTERVLRFTLNLFNGGDKEAGPSADLRASTLVDRGAAEAVSLSRDPQVQAELQETLGEVYQKLGNFDRADTLLSSALKQRRSASALVKLGLLRLDQARLEEAERLVRQGLSMPEGDSAKASATHALGMVLEARGSYDQAIQTLNEAIRLRSAPGAEKADLADSLAELANTYFYAGRLAESEALNKRLLVMHRELYGERHPLIADDLINLGAIQQDTGHYKEAERLHRQALDIVQAFYGKDHNRTAASLTQVARAVLPQGRYTEAEELLKQALVIRERTFGKVHPQVASTLNELGSTADLQDHHDLAEAYFQRVLDIYRTVYGGKHYLIGIALANLGSVYISRKEYGRAEPLFREALAMYTRTLAPGSVNEGIVHIKLGRVLRRQNRFAEAEKESLSGYRIVSRQTSPSVSWLNAARKDLAAIYTGLGEPDKAKEFLAK